MYSRLKLLLPLVQIGLAALLWKMGQAQIDQLARNNDSLQGYIPLPVALCIGINAPLFLPLLLDTVAIVKMGLENYWDVSFAIPFVGALWYWVACNFESWKRHKRLAGFASAKPRVVADILVLILAAALALFGIYGSVIKTQELYRAKLNVHTSGVVFENYLSPLVMYGLFVFWAVVLTYGYVGDLRRVLSREFTNSQGAS